MCDEAALSVHILLAFTDGDNLLKELGIRSLPLTGISHLSHLLHEHSNALAVLEWAASLESWALASQTLALGNKISVWAHAFAKNGAIEHYVIQGDAHGGLEEKNIQVL